MPGYFLVKSEPETYAFDDLRRDGRTVWDGVRNFAARGHLKEMKLGDQVLFYHSGDSKAVVGVAEVARESFPDASDETGRFLAVELKYVRPLKAPVTLAALKAEPSLADLKMVRQGRLSVSPVKPGEWKAILRMAGE
ncbi:EVE domain-containing protein [Phenylobacterium sp.]|uniref:EVE domain-containing protein n=1 Tax=Phenylobacterium sp. TaxID=1871053 RepID=UPI0025D49F19|nr:EVE domain-containing protein [Phenylobacterium sp.]MBX3482830.1 EVE domain-containing protein [Phenylobacterium sp.]MCW5758566.1 EVE domain-containing protein [Phenylobacterium sp.]